MAKRNSAEIVLSAKDEASKEIEKSIKKTTRDFTSLNRSLKGVGLNSQEIDKINKHVKNSNPKILEKELQNVRNKLTQLGLSSKEIDKITNEMTKTEKETQKVQKETKKASNLLKTMGKVGKVALAAAATGAAAAGAGLFALTKKAGETADRLLDLNSITGLSTDEIQKWQKASVDAGVSSEAMTDAAQKMAMNIASMQSPTSKGAKALKELGLSVEEVSEMDAGQQMDVLAQALAGVDDKTKRAKLGTDVFGRSWEKIAPIMDLGVEGMQKAKDSANIISNEDLQKANEFRKSWDTLKDTASKLAVQVGAKLAPTFTQFSDWITNNMPQIESFIKSAFEKSSDIINNSVIPAFNDFVTFLQDNKDKVEKELKKALEVATQAFDGLKQAVKFVKDNFDTLLPVIIGVTAAVVAQMTINKLVGLYKAWQMVTKTQTTLQWLLNTALNANPLGLVAVAIGAVVAAGILLYKNWDKVKSYAISLWEKLGPFKKAFIALLGPFASIVEAGIKIYKNWDTIKDKAAELTSKIIKVFKEFGGNVKTTFVELKDNMVTYGKNIVKGLIDGVSDKLESAKKKAKELASGIKDAITNFFQIKSPSRLMKQYGNWIGEGLIDGMHEKVSAAKKTAEELAEAIADTARKAFNKSKQWIDDRKYYNELSLVQELRAWERVQSRYRKGTEERKEAEREIYRVKQEIYKKVKGINEDYLAQVKSVNQQVADEEKRLTEQYQQAFESRRNSLYGFTDLFSEFTKKEVSGKGLIDNLKSQVVAFKDWQKNVKSLAEKGINEGLLKELRGMGPKAAGEIAALNSLSEKELEEYAELWKEKHNLANEQATNELRKLKEETGNKIDELHTVAAEKLDLLRNEWVKKIQSIRTGTQGEFDGLSATMPGVGEGIIQGLMDGLNSKKGQLFEEVQKIASRVQKVMSSVSGIVSSSNQNKTIIKAKKDFQAASDRGDKAGMDAARKKAEDARKAGGTIGADVTLEDALKDIPGLATGGTVTRGGLTWVGERGKELLDLPKGARVTPLDKTGNTYNNTHNHTYHNTYHVSLNIDAKDLDEIKKIIKLFSDLSQASRAGGAY